MCDKHRDLKHIGEKRVSLAYASTPLFITEGSQAKNSNRKNPGGGADAGALMASSACFHVEVRTASLGMEPPTMAGPPRSVTI